MKDLVTQPIVSLQRTGLATQLLKVKDLYECLIKLVEMMGRAKYTINKAVQAIQKLDCGEALAAYTAAFKKECKTMAFLK